ncbi:GntR family transcriptional regulator [Streptomyces sp. TP-A0874]|uniref:GntR family transcriptional regulator n=1 Tax=Streptomyces sp. TP-A0874 TaxID=549819 RepID=UPI000852C964|nr:GntR family transcriptional regulator [Streptomyces sp. TP-A0874]
MPGSGGGRGGSGARSAGAARPSRTTVTRNTLRQQIADALRDEVVAGRLPAGQHVSVKEIAEQYGVSATPVREALVDLSAQGLIDLEHHRGFQVHRFGPEDFRAMVEARTLVVEAVIDRIDGRRSSPATAAALVSVRRRAEEACRASRAGDLDILIGYDLRFWRELSSLIGNQYICDLLDRMRVQGWVFTVPHLRRKSDLKSRLWCRHRELVDAVERGDGEATRQIIADYDNHALALLEELPATDGTQVANAPPTGGGERDAGLAPLS